MRCGAQVSYSSHPLDSGATGLLLLRIGGPKKRKGTDMSAAADSEITGARQLSTSAPSSFVHQQKLHCCS